MSEEKRASAERQAPDPNELVLRLYRQYAADISKNLWPWEKARWYELIFCMLTTIAEPQVMAVTIRYLTNLLADLGLLDVPALAKLRPGKKMDDKATALSITLTTLLEAVGFSSDMATSALTAMGEAASVLQERYDGKVQLCLNKYGTAMLDQIHEEFAFSQFDEAPRALAIWLQNTLNMPIPASNPLADRACESLGVAYETLVKAANQQDINVALLDDALRTYYERSKNP